MIINGGMAERTADKLTDPLHARCLVLDDGSTKAALVVVDSCMMPRDLLDEAKELASRATGIPTSHMLISATHTHSAPSVHGALGSDKDEEYARFLPTQIAKGISEANRRSAGPHWLGVRRRQKGRGLPALDDEARTGRDESVRRDEGRCGPDESGAGESRRHPPHRNARSGRAGRFAADARWQAPGVYSAYSLHYVGKTTPVSADYFGVYCDEIARRLKAENDRSFMAALANATSGDTWLMDYSQPTRRDYSLQSVANDVATAAMEAYGRFNTTTGCRS